MLQRILKQAAKQKQVTKAAIHPKSQINDHSALSEILLVVLAGVGVVSVSLIAPNLFSAIGKLSKTFKNLSKEEQSKLLTRSFYYLKKTGKISFKTSLKDVIVNLTQLGKKQAKEINFENLKVPKPKVWDKRWWQVAADIPTKEYKLAADALRHKLLKMNFCGLQRSLWYHPYDPRKELAFVLERYNVGKFVTIMEISRMDKADEKILKTYFKKTGIL